MPQRLKEAGISYGKNGRYNYKNYKNARGQKVPGMYAQRGRELDTPKEDIEPMLSPDKYPETVNTPPSPTLEPETPEIPVDSLDLMRPTGPTRPDFSDDFNRERDESRMWEIEGQKPPASLKDSTDSIFFNNDSYFQPNSSHISSKDSSEKPNTGNNIYTCLNCLGHSFQPGKALIIFFSISATPFSCFACNSLLGILNTFRI